MGRARSQGEVAGSTPAGAVESLAGDMRLFGWFMRKPAKLEIPVRWDPGPTKVERPVPQTVEDREPWRNPRPWAEGPHNPKNRAKPKSWIDGFPDPEKK